MDAVLITAFSVVEIAVLGLFFSYSSADVATTTIASSAIMDVDVDAVAVIITAAQALSGLSSF